MKNQALWITILMLFVFEGVQASALSQFLRSCAYGTATGAVLGVVSLALTDKPGEDVANIAKGASLGLYGGIAYGFYQLSQEPQVRELQAFVVSPVYLGQKGIETQVSWIYQF